MSRIALVDNRNANAQLARKAGHTEADIVEIIMRVGMNLIVAMIAKSSHLEIAVADVANVGSPGR